MSRSYKKPYIKQDGTKWAKRLANKRVRHTEDVGNYGSYKKVFCSYDISDYRFYWDDPRGRRK